ncbi:MAG: site-specific DNA-methyltransferase [Candidatus Binatia bacterium]
MSTKIVIAEDSNRRIGSRDHNRHVAEGINAHKATQIVPSPLLNPFSADLQERINQRHEEVEQILSQHLGKPYFSQDGFILFNGSCVELLEKLRDSNANIDLALTSPPYNIGKEYEKPLSLEEYISWCSRWMNQIYNVVSDRGAFWLNLGYLEVPEKGLCVPIPYLLWDKSPFYMIQEVVWAYGAGVSAKSRLSPRNEKWLFYVKDREHYTFNLDEIRDPNVKYPNQKKNGRFRCNPLGKNPSDVWELPKVTTGKDRSSKERSGHPAQFPLSVVERIVKAASNPAEVVLDPFAGSCSTGIAATGLGRVFVGFELREDYCKASVQRFKDFLVERKDALKQTSLF